jgi:prepilin-type N-terminal cleavage/methylation domain-containing protein/prepilin-type processing-associated H-X9-DG protein
MEVVVERRNKAFTLIELLVVIAIIALLIGILLPALGQARRSAANLKSSVNMRSMNTGAANYASDNSDRIFAYNWRKFEKYMMPDGRTVSENTDTDAASRQNQEILQRVTGRISKVGKILSFDGRLPHRRYSHLVLLDFLTDVQPEPSAASPFDRNLIIWQEDPLAYLEDGSGFPYAEGVPEGYDPGNSGDWADPPYVQRWPFASTYQMVPVAWCGDGINGQDTYAPVDNTPHLFTPLPLEVGDQELPPNLGRRKFTQVAHPSGKVMMFEEFDRFSDSAGLYFAYPEAKCNLAFFDGSVRNLQTSDANPGWNPITAQQGAMWTQNYVPLDTFPLPKSGLGEDKEYCMRYRWTRYGLQGIDYGGQDIGTARFPQLQNMTCP